MENQNSNGLYREDVDRFENQLQQLRDMMVRQNSLLEDMKSKDNDLSVIQMQIESIEKKSENIEKKNTTAANNIGRRNNHYRYLRVILLGPE